MALEVKDLMYTRHYSSRANSAYHTYKTNPLSKDLIGTSDCNHYIPVFALEYHNLLEIKHNDDEDCKVTKVLEYGISKQIPRMEGFSMQHSSTYNQLFHRLNGGETYIQQHNIRVGGVVYSFLVDDGILIAPDGKILMCLAISSEYLFSKEVSESRLFSRIFNPADNTTPEGGRTSPMSSEVAATRHKALNEIPTNELALFISNELGENPIYKNLAKRIDMTYISNIKDAKIDLVYVNSIENRLFKNNFAMKKFSKISDMKKHLTEVPEIILE